MNSTQRKRILLVENQDTHETSLRDVLATKLETDDWSIACVHSLSDAEETLRNRTFDILLCDVCLPDGTGSDVVRRLHAVPCNVPIVVVCGDDEHELGDDALSSGATDRVLRRQLTQQFLVRVIDDVVRIHSMERREEALRAGLHIVSDSINTDKPLDQTLDSVLIGLSHVVDYESAAILLTEEDGYRHIVAARGFSGSKQAVGLRIQVGKDELFDEMTRTHQPIVIFDARSDPRFQGYAGTQDTRGWIGVPLIFNDTVIGAMTVDSLVAGAYDQRDAEIVSIFANQAAVAIKNAQLFKEVQHLARTDDLTGLHNRRHFFHRGNLEFTRAQRYDLSLSAIMVDIDHFKHVNDTWGHAVGDAVIVDVAQRLRDNIREIDILGRYGGEEFSILLPETAMEEAVVVGRRLCRHIADRPFRVQAHEILLTVSAGVASRSPDVPDLDTLLDRADMALYMAKRAGRNCVKAWQPTTEA